MKPSVAVALIIAGTILIIAPYLSSAFGTNQVAKLMLELHGDVNLRSDMPSWYAAGSFVAGLLMVSVAVVTSLRREAV